MSGVTVQNSGLCCVWCFCICAGPSDQGRTAVPEGEEVKNLSPDVGWERRGCAERERLTKEERKGVGPEVPQTRVRPRLCGRLVLVATTSLSLCVPLASDAYGVSLCVHAHTVVWEAKRSRLD